MTFKPKYNVNFKFSQTSYGLISIIIIIIIIIIIKINRKSYNFHKGDNSR